MTEMVLEDEYGKRTKFRGVRLSAITTEDEGRPRWAEMDVWRTEGGAYIIQRKTAYRWRHLSETCPRYGANILPRQATEQDIHPCPRCNRHGVVEPGRGYGAKDRITIDVARTPVDLITMLANQDGTYSGLVREVLAEVSEQDDAVSELWMNEVVP